MSSFTISPTLNKDKVFILNLSQVEHRLDPNFYRQIFKDNIEKIKANNYKRIGEVVKFSNETWNQKDFFSSTFPYIEISEIDTLSGDIKNLSEVDIADAPSRAKMIVRENDIIVSTTRPNRGAISFVKRENDFSIASTGFAVIRSLTTEEFDKEYLFAVLRQKFSLLQLEQRSSGGNYPAITQDELSNVVIPIPNKSIQEKVKAIFNTCFELKSKNEATAANILRSIDTYLLQELGITLPTPPENILTNRMFTVSMNEISGKRFDPAYHQVYFHKLVASIVNSKYKSRRIGEEINEINYGASFTNDYVESGVPLLRIKDLRRNEIVIDKVVFLPEIARKLLGNSFVKQNDFLISRSGTIGVVSLVSKEIDGFAFGSFMIKFNLKSDKVLNREFLSYYLNCKLLIDLIERDKIGAIQGNITIPIIKSLLVPVPPLDKQKEIADHITGIRKQAQQLKDKTKELLKKASEEIEEILLN
ncbi:restriction endonuclease subunit S [Williamwhitmania taraxaci]|uniref:Type I restriction enzyme, S subunit n=1 Tax=Williamwhitmania taraxaci TaxID=1640674 RepID=A0A1G6NQ04_9BACT|nr:restriction endonuclease subunit S [Williamwhitmania taraxaci]SDC69245.1 type I restriction enzyme, S subunit [Williamwhitmania taraxaci]